MDLLNYVDDIQTQNSFIRRGQVLDQQITQLHEQLAIAGRCGKNVTPSALVTDVLSIAQEGVSINVGAPSWITRMIEIIKGTLRAVTDFCIDLFKWLTDRYYRARRRLILCHQNYLAVTDEATKVAFESAMLKIPEHDLVSGMIDNLVAFYLEMQSASAVSTSDHLDRFLVTATSKFGCVWKDGVLVNMKDLPTEYPEVKLKDAGYRFVEHGNDIVRAMSLATQLSDLRQIETNTAKDLGRIERDIRSFERNNGSAQMVSELQATLESKRKVLAFVTAGLSIGSVRFGWVEKQFLRLDTLLKK